MALQFAVLASGSRGNVSFARETGPGLLIDLGIGPRSLESRLNRVGAEAHDIGAVLLTHTHRDHVGPAALRWAARQGVMLYCHEAHAAFLDCFTGFRILVRDGLVRTYDERPFLTPNGQRVEPIPVSHDGGPTFGFRVEFGSIRRARRVSLGYLADTGCWNDHMADALTDVDVLGIEFNHDVELQRRSGRPAALIARNLGNHGHLSNDQGAGLLTTVLRNSRSGTPRHVVLLHLSRECNRREIAVQAAKAAIRAEHRRVVVHVGEQDFPGPSLVIHPGRARAGANPRMTASAAAFPWEAA